MAPMMALPRSSWLQWSTERKREAKDSDIEPVMAVRPGIREAKPTGGGHGRRLGRRA